MRLNISQKLIVVIIILVIAPILATGLLANRAAKQIVTQLLNESQIALAREIAEQANHLFRTAKADIKILSALPALSDYYYNRFYNLHSEADISRKQIEGFFIDMAKKSEFYYRISYLNADGAPIVNISGGPDAKVEESSADVRLSEAVNRGFPSPPHVSSILTTENGQRQVIRFLYPLFDVWDHLSGVVCLELDFDKISSYILSRRVGLNGFAFVVDNYGRIQIHPEKQLLGQMYDRIDNPSITEMVVKMLRDRQGMASYMDVGSKVAAFTPVMENGWTVAVALPESEFAQRADIVGKQMLLIVAIAASITVFVGVLFSWQFVKPIKQLAQATNVISAGGLPRQLDSSSRDELGILTRSFNHMVRNLRRVQAELVQSEKLSSLGRLATGVAHEIRNPLNDMKVAAEILYRKHPTAQEAGELLKLIVDEIAHLETFVADFLSYARQPPLKTIDFDANQLVTDVLLTSRGRLEKNNIDYKMVLTPGRPLVAIDPFQMERALLNIVFNAIDAMPSGGCLSIITEVVDGSMNMNGRFRIQVADTGQGLSSEQLAHVFDPFFSTKDYGTGLGLSLTKSIIEAHEGTITIALNNGPGVTVFVALPIISSEA